MLHELEKRHFSKVLPLFEGYLQDPLMYATLEGHRGGWVFVDDPVSPAAAFVWTDSECAYFVTASGDDRLGDDVRRLVVEQIIPAAQATGRDYLSVFVFPNAYAAKLEMWLGGQLPLKTPVNTFCFNEDRFRELHGAPRDLPVGFVLKEIDREVLDDPENRHLADEVVVYWGSVDAFLSEGLGYCVLDGNKLVSCCYVQTYGCGAETIDIWTAQEYRRRGLAVAVASAWVERCLLRGRTPFWLCDLGNVASRGLAERLGFEYRGDIFLVDIPFDPFEFYRGLAGGFFIPTGQHRKAAEAYERAFTVREGEADDYYTAAWAWALAGDSNRALVNLQKAVDRNWGDVALLESTDAFKMLQGSERWQALMACISKP